MNNAIKNIRDELKDSVRRLDELSSDIDNIRIEILESFDDIMADEIEKRNDAIAEAAADLTTAIFGSDEYAKRYGLLDAVQQAIRVIDSLPLDVRLKLSSQGAL